ncbi:MAG: hypothetical protein EBV27_04580 [Actinobacteria bacterium]|jgi:hypothetical protein|nr:hypothetical protein [Actinomycetota bacterium]
MTNPNEVIIDATTNEVIVNQITPQKVAQLAAEGLRIEEERLADIEARKNTKAALITKLGITEEEAQLLWGDN